MTESVLDCADMPFACRNIEPSRLGAHEVPQDEDYEKKCVLYTVANNAIVGTLLQLSSLVRHADDLFCDISEECQKVYERTDKVSKRILSLENAVGKLDAKQAKIPEGDLKQFTAVTTHHQARHGYDANLFQTTNRPQCVQDLYNLSDPNPTKVIRAADLYRKDGLSGSKMFKCWPVLMNEKAVRTPDLNLPRRIQRVRSFEKKYKTLKIRERPKTIHGWDEFNFDDCKNELSEEKSKTTECLTSPEPPVVVSIDTSGSNFERMQSFRSSDHRYASKEEKEKKKRRRRTVSGVQNIMSEIEKFERKHKVHNCGRQTPRSYSFDDLDADDDDVERDEGILKYLDEIEGKMEERLEEEKAQKIMKFFPCRRSRSLPRCMKLSSVTRSLSADRKSQKDLNTSYVSSSISIASLTSNASSRLSRSAKRSSIIGNKIKSLVTNVKDKPKPRPKSLDIDTLLDCKARPRCSIEEHERSKSTYSLERNHTQTIPDGLLSKSRPQRSSSTIGPGSYYNFESSTLPRAQARKYDFPWESLPKDWTTSVKLREISKRRAREDRQSSSGNWSQSGTSSNRHSLDSDLRSEGTKFTSQYSLGKDSGRDSLTLEEENGCITDGTSTAGYAADTQSTITGDSVSVGNPKSDFTQLDTEAWIQSLAVRAAKREAEESLEKSSTLSRLTRQNILALDLMLAEGSPKRLADEESSVYSVDQEGFYTSFHNDSGLKKSTNTLVDESESFDISPTKDSASICSADSVIHRPPVDSDKFAGLRKGHGILQPKVISKVIPPTPPNDNTSHCPNQEEKLTESDRPELHSYPSHDSTVSESDAEAVFTRVQEKTNLSSTGFPSLVALSTSDDESSPESKSEKVKKGLSETVSDLGLSDIKDTSGFSFVQFQSRSCLDSSCSDFSFSSLKHSKSTLECTDQGYDSLSNICNKSVSSPEKSAAGYQSWPRTHKSHPGILKTPEKQGDTTRPQKTLNFNPVVNLFKEGAQGSVQVQLPSPTSSSCSESNNSLYPVHHMSSFQTAADQSYTLTVPVESDHSENQDKTLPSKYQPTITVTPRSRSRSRSGDRLSEGERSEKSKLQSNKSSGKKKEPIYAKTSVKPKAQSTPHVSANPPTSKQTSPSLYAVSPVMAPRETKRADSVTSTNSSKSSYMDMNSLKSAGSFSSLTSSESLNDTAQNCSTYMSMSSPCSSPNLSNMDFSISSTPSGSMDSLLDLRKTPTNELENDTYRINTNILVSQHNTSATWTGNRRLESVQSSSRKVNGSHENEAEQSQGHFRDINSSPVITPSRRSLDSSRNDLTYVTQRSFDSSRESLNSTNSDNQDSPSQTSRDSSRSIPRQAGRRSRADTRQEPSYRATNRRSLPSDMSGAKVQVRNVPLNDTRHSANTASGQQQPQHSVSSSRSFPLGFNSVLLSNSSHNSGRIDTESSDGISATRKHGYSSSSSTAGSNSSAADNGQSSRSDSYRIAMGNRTGSYRNAVHGNKSLPVLPPTRQSGPYRVAMDMSPNRAFNSKPIEDDVMSRADSYRIAVRNTNGIVPDMANRNTSYRVAVNDDIPSVVSTKLDALGMEDNKLLSGRDIRRMGITDVDQVKDVNPQVIMRGSKSASDVQMRIRDSKPVSETVRPNTSQSTSRLSQQTTPQQTNSQTGGRIRQCFKQDVDPIQVVATVDNNNVSKRTNKNDQNRSSTYIQFDPIFEDTEDFSNIGDLDLSSLDYSKSISNTSKAKYGLINGTMKDANANTVKMKKSGSGNLEVENDWRFSQV